MRFVRYGKTHQLCIETAEDLEEIVSLDESLWATTSAPISAFRCDPHFLDLVDTDDNDRIRTDELRAAVTWLLERLADRSGLTENSDTVPLAAIQSDTPEGRALLDSAGHVLESQGEQSSETISLDQVVKFMASVESQPLNGDGVIVPEAAADAETSGFIEDIATVTGGIKDAGGRHGICEEHLNAFMAAIGDYLDWRSEGETPPGQDVTPVMLLGPDTPEAFNLYQAHVGKVDLFFTLCRMVRFGPSTALKVAFEESHVRDLDLSQAEPVQAALERAPLAQPGPEALLPLSDDAVNPFYRQWICALKKRVLQPILGGVPERLSQADWERVKSVLAPYKAYLEQKKGASVEALPLDRLRQYRDGSFEQKVRELIELEKELSAIIGGVQDVERLLLYRRYLMPLANNFVSFPKLYAVDERALFEVGSTVMDGRWFNFAIRVDDVAAHSTVAGMSNIFVLYLEITGTTQETFCVAVPATSGNKGNLDVGKRGVFFDTDGKEFDAKIVKIMENPISLREALTAPFVRVWRFAAGKIEALSGTGEKQLEAQLEKTVVEAPKAAAAAEQAPAAKGLPGGPTGLLIGLSVAGAAIGSAFAFIVKTLAGLKFYQIGLGLLVAVLVVLLPVAIIAVTKLRRQDLSALLEACGWAINVRMRLNRAQRRYFTRYAPYPKGAEGTPGRRWLRLVLLVVILVGLAVGGYYAVRAILERRPGVESRIPPAPTVAPERDKRGDGKAADAESLKPPDMPAPETPPQKKP